MADLKLKLPLRTLALIAVIAACSCCDTEEWKRLTPEPDAEMFVNEVYPMLLRDCGFAACHGGPERFLQVFGPGRIRLDPDTTRVDDAIRLAEVRHSYHRARSLLATDVNVEESLLLSKPLELEAGGQGHEGVDDFGRNAFASTRDPRFRMLLRWAQSQGSTPNADQVDLARDSVEDSLEAIRKASP